VNFIIEVRKKTFKVAILCP